MPETRRPVGVLDTVSRGAMRSTTTKAKTDLKKMRPETGWGLGVAKVVTIDYEEFYVTLQTLTGASDTFERVPIPLTFPGAGARHFFGAMPEVGDTCIIGWLPQESSNSQGTRSPVILTWIIPGVWPGREWLTTGEFGVDEFDQESPVDRQFAEGAYNRVRHKLRHAQPGNVVASSSQGADFILDESVRLANRRGNEFRLRDQDQAAILRALQSFQALAGARVYAGMVQRDALALHPSMVGDDNLWDGSRQASAKEPVSDLGLPTDQQSPEGFLTPARILRKGLKDAEGGYLGRSFLGDNPYLDPYEFMRLGGFIDETGFVAPGTQEPDAIYGGKIIYRVSSQSRDNAHLDPDKPTLTEYRIDVTHTSDGRLPVTEQTDGFDAERLPSTDPSSAPEGLPPNMPFIECVMGSVVGNDPFSQQGRTMYGLPLQAIIFDGTTPSPRLEAANIPLPGSGVQPTPLEEQAATLMKLTPPIGPGGPETFWSLNKKGQLKASIGGPPGESSIEAYLHGGLKLGMGGKLELLLNGHVSLGTRSQNSLDLSSEAGQVKIFGGGGPKDASDKVESVSGSGQGSGNLPSVDIQGRTNVRVKAEKTVFLKGNIIDGNATSVQVTAHQNMDLNATKSMSLTTDAFHKTVNGKAQESYAGPKGLLPTSGPLHERNYSPAFPGMVAEKVTYTSGDRREKFTLGNHKTEILVGNMTFDLKLGVWKAKAVTSSMELSSSGITGAAKAGNVSLKASAGTATMEGQAAATVSSAAGTATLKGGSGVYLGGPISGPDQGPIICAGSLDPFTNLPFSTFGMGAKSHIVGS